MDTEPMRTSILIAALLLSALPQTVVAATPILPAVPSPGLRVTAGVWCDFEDLWWEAALYPGAELPLEFRYRSPGITERKERETTRDITPTERSELYALAQQAFAEFRLDRRPNFSVGPDQPQWSGERTITIAALVLDQEIGRVDRIEFDIDVIRGRELPPAILAYVRRMASFSRQARLDLGCR